MAYSSPTVPATPVQRPTMPSITGSALLESRRLLATTRRLLAAWLARA